MCSRSCSVPRSISAGSMNTVKSPRRRPEFPGSLTDLHRYRKTVHGHDGDSRIIMVRKTDERTYASIETGKEPLLETVTRETVETFRGQRTQLRVTTERKEKNEKVPPDLLEALGENYKKTHRIKRSSSEIPSKMDLQKEFLKAHNELRAKHGVAALKLNATISKLSQLHAEKMLRTGKFEHSDNQKYGENIFYMWSPDPNFNVGAYDVVRSWYAEIDNYTFGVEPKQLNTGHFTQVVWNGSKELGVGLARSKGRVYVVANYYPPGNVKGLFAKNVFPPREANNNELAKSFNKLDVSDRSRRSTPTHTPNSYRSVIEGTEGNFEEDFLKAHNDYRARHGVPPLKLDRKISKYAEEWAKMLAVKNVLEHRKNNPYGENIYMMYSSDPNFKITGNSPVDAWYDEIKYHTFGREPNSLKSGHFTQVVWKSSELVGVGVAKSKQGSIYVVANYSPPGNFVGSYAQNVPPLLSTSSSDNTPSHNPADSPGTRIARSIDVATGKFTQFQTDALKAHNELRRRHGVPDLVLDKGLCDFAQEWAEYCLRHDLGLRSNNPYGENLLTVTSSDSKRVPDAKDVVDTWYREISKHDYNKESLNYDTLHFSQIVWNGTKELGIGVAQNERGKAVIVANYSPRGNVYGQFKTNVFKPKV
ncbi:uncharacterized protein LOC108744254 isoform X2 [Agrilus planipennis]|uniref:Uncharacterized protein LOC108744254 isoform X2 n=1 Tax=Agrilus planipennis TaxID=224129 RepID=A0A1W4XHH4_AGRPL|nr:uncharacterized protein LOC108744254 isoform X2 [Agrilus planipennis]